MKRSTWLLWSSMSAMLATGACGGSSSSGGTGGSGGSKCTPSTGTGTDTGITNGCSEAMATDDTCMSTVTIDFGGTAGLKYSPPCVKVKTGTTVTFSGNFTTHPLAGGVSGTKDPTSPITETKTGTSAMFTLSTAGTFGFFCEIHQSVGMQGALYVQ